MPPDNVIPLPEPEDDLQQQAMSWVTRLNSGEASKGDRQAFSLWIQQSREHRQAYFAARRLWLQMAQLDLTETNAPPVEPPNPPPAATRQPRIRPFYKGIALMVLLVGLLPLRPLYLRYFVADFYTGVGEIKTLRLSDGSTVYLNTDSLIAEHYSQDTRNIELLTGEAEFDVAPDKTRPFIVTAGNGKTRALGTRFVVKYADDKVRIGVLEHAVEISSENHESVTLNSGYKLEYGSKGLLDIPKTINKSEVDAWRDGKLKFTAKPLKEVIAEIDRYLPGKIVLANAGFDDHQVSGVFEIKNIDRAIHVIAKSLHLQTANIGLLTVIY